MNATHGQKRFHSDQSQSQSQLNQSYPSTLDQSNSSNLDQSNQSQLNQSNSSNPDQSNQDNSSKQEYISLVENLNSLKMNFNTDPIFLSKCLQKLNYLLDWNPEFYSMWNFKRRISKLLCNFDQELEFTLKCLKKSPKSYWVWNYRRFILETMPNPDWSRELELVSMMLDLDTRNFHGWDYRRYIISKSNIKTADQEFEYTTRKIYQNFSNFSAWHYRSKLSEKLNIDWDQEFEMVRNAIFTEPADQSAWLYHQWLLSQQQDTMPIEAGFCNNRIGIRFNQKIDGSFELQGITFKSFSTMLVGEFNGDLPCLVFPPGLVFGKSSKCSSLGFTLTKVGDKLEIVTNNQDTRKRETWVKEYNYIRELEELEQDSKWVLLTLVFIQNHLDYHEEATKNIEKLITIDPCRRKVYERMKILAILKNPPKQINLENQNLKHSNLDSLAFCDTINLSFNNLDRVSCHGWINCQKLNLSNNKLVSVKELKNLSLKWLDLSDNLLTFDSFQGLNLQLDFISLKNNTMTQDEEEALVERFTRQV